MEDGASGIDNEGEGEVTDEQIERFMELFKKYRNDGKLPPDEREEFKKLSALWRRKDGYLPSQDDE